MMYERVDYLQDQLFIAECEVQRLEIENDKLEDEVELLRGQTAEFKDLIAWYRKELERTMG